ncbi:MULTISPECIES: hypothetical protein [Streptomyces]|uniref:Flavodoxin-like domain-containing protein n=1 Tax=Streptomyces dengpaensis TaxID=2049881 RepID=A0ABM6SSB6_9ACTN|nr:MULTISPECIES: hypothetical protein [Streptomyces]AVH57515.1 hypothetical protein C4B68_18975 [Streptomyces dengpaensis]PIB04114.1 hypothetical protein B1C81_34390 [Streptomyces sp. HG99]
MPFDRQVFFIYCSRYSTGEREELCDYIDEALPEHGVDVVALTARHGLGRYPPTDLESVRRLSGGAAGRLQYSSAIPQPQTLTTGARCGGQHPPVQRRLRARAFVDRAAPDWTAWWIASGSSFITGGGSGSGIVIACLRDSAVRRSPEATSVSLPGNQRRVLSPRHSAAPTTRLAQALRPKALVPEEAAGHGQVLRNRPGVQ